MANFENQVFAICGKTVSSLRRNVIRQLPQWLGGVVEFTEHRQDNRLTARVGNRVNTYYLFGGQDESSYALIQGITLAGVLLDEVALMPRSFVEQAVARCSVEGSKMWFSCNPDSKEHWFYKEWICGAKEKNALYLHFTMADNPGLSDRIRQRYQSLYSGIFYRRYILGQWCKVQGLVYPFEEQTYLAQTLPRQGRWYISVDYGTQNPFSAGLWCVSDGVAVRMAEFYHSGRDSARVLTDEQYYQALEELAGDKPVEQVIIDPSAASMIAVIRKAGRFSVRRARNDVLQGIRLVTSLLCQGRLKIAPCCKDCLREFSLYAWEDDCAKDRPCKQNDHAMDDMRYFCMGVMR